jgi:hypothetical protein
MEGVVVPELLDFCFSCAAVSGMGFAYASAAAAVFVVVLQGA